MRETLEVFFGVITIVTGVFAAAFILAGTAEAFAIAVPLAIICGLCAVVTYKLER